MLNKFFFFWCIKYVFIKLESLLFLIGFNLIVVLFIFFKFLLWWDVIIKVLIGKLGNFGCIWFLVVLFIFEKWLIIIRRCCFFRSCFNNFLDKVFFLLIKFCRVLWIVLRKIFFFFLILKFNFFFSKIGNIWCLYKCFFGILDIV